MTWSTNKSLVVRRAVAAMMAACLAWGFMSTSTRQSATANTDIVYTGFAGDPIEEEVKAAATASGVTEQQAHLNFSLNDAVAALDEAARKMYPSTYAGIWRQNADGQPVRLAFTSSADSSARDVISSTGFPRPDLVVAQSVSRSLIELEGLKNNITAAFNRGTYPAVLSSVAVDPAGNRVRVGVTESQSTVAATLSLLHGDSVMVEQEAPFHFAGSCQNRTTCTPNEFRGTMQLIGADGHSCSAGFPTYNGVITAGHCFDEGVTSVHSGLRVGVVERRAFGGQVDGEWIAFGFPTPWRGWPWIIAGSDFEYDIVNRLSTENVGDFVCRDGVTSGYQCGSIVSIGTVNISEEDGSGARQLTDQRIVQACALPGDSGGPVFSSAGARGITSGSNFTRDGQNRPACFRNGMERFTYSNIVLIENAVGRRVQTTYPEPCSPVSC